jgi:hypothetical protein
MSANEIPKTCEVWITTTPELSYSPWECQSIDFKVALAESEGQTQIMVLVDHFSKIVHFIALVETATPKDGAQAFLNEVWKLRGLPKSMISNRDTK